MSQTADPGNLALRILGLPWKAILGDGTHKVTAISGHVTVDVTGWNPTKLHVTLPDSCGYHDDDR